MIQNGYRSDIENQFRSVPKDQHESAWIIKAQILVAAIGIVLLSSRIVWKLFFRD